MTKVLIGWAETIQGVLEDESAADGSITVRTNVEEYRHSLELLVPRMRRPGESDRDLLLGLPGRLRSYVWARILTKSDETESKTESEAGADAG